jgi:hypothetical protein
MDSSHRLSVLDYEEKSGEADEKNDGTEKPETNGYVNEKVEEGGKDSPSHSEPQSRRSTIAGLRGGGRHISGMQRLLDWFPAGPPSEKPSTATLSDYGLILNILVAVHEHLPVRALLTSVPLLLVLDETSKGYREREPQRYNALQEMLARVWSTLGRVWDCESVVEAAQMVRHTLIFSEWPAETWLPPRL